MENKYGRFAFMPLSVKSSHIAVEDEMMINYDEGELYVRKGSANILIASSKVSTHIHDTDNPHKVTKEQVGLGNVTNVTPVKQDDFIAHINDKNNPHGVTKEHVGLGNVMNYGIATTEDIADGKSDKYLTPKVFLDYLDEYDIGIIDPGGGGGPGTDPDDPKPPIKKEGTVTFIVTPSDAIISVNVDGEWKRGSIITLPYGSYQYKIEKQGYITKESILTLDMSNLIIRELLHEISPSVGSLIITVIPVDSLVEVELSANSWAPVTGNSISLLYGRYKYRISKSGYTPIQGVANIDKSQVYINHSLEKIQLPPDPGGGTEPTDPPIIDEPDPGQVNKNEIFITNYRRFSDVVIDRVGEGSVNIRYNKNDGIFEWDNPNELYRITLIPSNMIYKIIYLYITTGQTNKFIEVELEEEDLARLTFKVAELSMDNIVSYSITIKSKISSIDEDSPRYINETIQGSVADIKEIDIPKSLYDISIQVILLTGHKFTMTSARTEYLQDIDFLITVNDYTRIEIKNYPQDGKTIGIFTNVPLGRFTTMTVPTKPEVIIEKKNNKTYGYIPKDSILYVMISEPMQPPKLGTFTDIDENTVIDINDI